MTMVRANDVSIPEGHTGPDLGANPAPCSPQVERYAALLWLQSGASAPLIAQPPAVQATYRKMATSVRTAVLGEVVARSDSQHSQQGITRCRADLSEERARMAERMERLHEYIRLLELRVGPDDLRVLQAVAGIRPEDLDPAGLNHQ
jgi:hypothetical protein